MIVPARFSLVFGTLALLGLLVACNKTSSANPAGGASGAGAAGAAGSRNEMQMTLKNYQVSISKKIDDLKTKLGSAGPEIQKSTAEPMTEIENKRKDLTKRIGELPAEGWEAAAKDIKTGLGELEKSINEIAAKVK